jgi:hypothetical protein
MKSSSHRGAAFSISGYPVKIFFTTMQQPAISLCLYPW